MPAIGTPPSARLPVEEDTPAVDPTQIYVVFAALAGGGVAVGASGLGKLFARTWPWTGITLGFAFLCALALGGAFLAYRYKGDPRVLTIGAVGAVLLTLTMLGLGVIPLLLGAGPGSIPCVAIGGMFAIYTARLVQAAQEAD